MSHAESVKNVVLVHGGFVDGSGWQGVYDLLTKDGYNVSVVQNPTTSLADDVAVTKRALAAQNGPAILVGHSYGGVVITEAGTDPEGRRPRLHRGLRSGQGRVRVRVNPEPAAWCGCAADPPATGWLSVSRSDEVSRVIRRGCQRGRGGIHGGLAGPVGARGAQRRRDRARVENEAKLVSRGDGGQDDSARRAARDVEACGFGGSRGRGQSRRLRVTAASRCRDHREGGKRRRDGHTVGTAAVGTRFIDRASRKRDGCRPFREAGEAVSDDAVRAPRETFSTVSPTAGPGSDGRAV